MCIDQNIRQKYIENLQCIHHLLVTLYTRIVGTSQISFTWKYAKIILGLIQQKGNTNDSANDRPILFTGTIAVRFCIANKVIDHEDQKEFIFNGIVGCSELATVFQNSIRHFRRTKHTIHVHVQYI